MGNKTIYHADNHFKVDRDLIYLLQRKGMDQCNDIAIRVQQQNKGHNPMPEEVKQRLINHLHKAANEFLYVEGCLELSKLEK